MLPQEVLIGQIVVKMDKLAQQENNKFYMFESDLSVNKGNCKIASAILKLRFDTRS